MAKILFIDDRFGEVIPQWERSGCAARHELLLLNSSDALMSSDPLYAICEVVKHLEPDIILVGYGLGTSDFTGADIVRSLRENGYSGYIVANSGGGVEPFNQAGVTIDGTANRNPHDLKMVVDKLTEKRR